LKNLPTVRQLRYFIALADSKSFTRAAALAGVSQPSFSLQIQILEKLLGGRLVERGARIILTPLGRQKISLARDIIARIEEFSKLAKNDGGELSGTLRFGVSPTLGPYLLPQLVARLHATHPTLKVHVREGLPSALVEQLAEGVHDVILVQLPVEMGRFHVERLFREALYVAMAADDPLRIHDTLTLEHLAGRGLLTLQPEYRMSDQVTAIAGRAGATVLRGYEGTSLNAIRQMAGMGMGLALLPEFYVRQEVRRGADVIVKPLASAQFYRDIGLVWRSGTGKPPSLLALVEGLKAVAQKDAGHRKILWKV
jgi:LysR family transcriptional regulator, hydrogen peroxide-inducible genes activator